MTANNRATNQQTLFNISSIWINRVVLILIPLISTPLITNTFGLGGGRNLVFSINIWLSTFIIRDWHFNESC